MDKTSLKSELEKSTDIIVELCTRFPNESWNISPEKGRWSAAQILEHLLISEELITRLMDHKGIPCTNREPDEKILTIRALFTDDDLKLTAGEPIQPSPGNKDKSEQLERFQSLRAAQKRILEKYELEEIVRLFKHPKFGELTRGEWFWFNILHSQRHARQIKALNNIYS